MDEPSVCMQPQPGSLYQILVYTELLQIHVDLIGKNPSGGSSADLNNPGLDLLTQSITRFAPHLKRFIQHPGGYVHGQNSGFVWGNEMATI
jgi:hypothetical protein